MARKRPNRIVLRTVTRHIAGAAPSVEKSLPAGLLGNVGGRATDVSALVQVMQQPVTGDQTPMPRDTFPYSFGPGVPLRPAPLDPVRPDTGRAEPRQWQYPVTWNIHVPGQDNRLVPWKLLRDAADRIAIIRDCIRVRKNEILGLDWDIVISQRAVETAQRDNPSAKRIDLERDMRTELGPQIDRLAEFWQEPDKRNGHDFPTWISKVLEEHLVLDALAIYPRLTLGGDLYGLEVLDGTTIKPLLDHTGGRPLPPFPAYQQVLHGFPRGEYVADADPDDIDGYAADKLIYRVKEARTFTPYGFSAVEQSLEDADLWLNRKGWLKAEYTDGVMPAGWLKQVNAGAGWTPAQVLEYEETLNDYYSGLTKQRMRYRLLPPNVEPVESRGVDERYKPDYDLHLLKLLVAHFDLSIAELGFTEAKGLGGSSYHEGQENALDRKTTRPTLTWLAGVLTDISRKHLAMPRELEFKWLGLDDEDQAVADEVNRTRFQAGGITLNEWRDERGEPRYSFAEADMPMIVTQRGVVFVEGASELAPPGELIEPAQAEDDPEAQAAEEDDAQPGEPAAKKPAPADDEPAEPAEAKKTELAAYRRWARKGRANRPFEFVHLTRVDAEQSGVDLSRVTFKAAGDADPKDQDPAWPAWEIDEKVAKFWAPEISRAFAGIDTDQLARRWTEARKSADADAWLSTQGLSLTAALQRVLEGVYGDGYVIGLHAAQYMVDRLADPTVTWSTNWGAWTPGNREAARAIAGPGLDRLLEQSGVTIRSIAANRTHELGDALAEGLDEGWAVDKLGRALRDVLDDPGWAYAVAVTETNRAVTFASQQTYLQNGIDRTVWIAVPGACPLCQRNADAGPVRLGQPFPSGATGPPGHPHCRCATAPHIESITEIL